MVIEINVAERHKLIPLFANCRYDRVLIDSVLEGKFGSAYADSANCPEVARLDSGAFTMLGGNPYATGVTAVLNHAPIDYVTPQNDGWRQRLQDAFGERIASLSFTTFSAAGLEPPHLKNLVAMLAPGFELRQINRSMATQLPADLDNDYFFENFHSRDDFLKRGLGFGVLHQGRIVSAATSMARSRRAIDIEIETHPAFQGRGLGTAVAARLVLACMEQGIEPQWLAANAASEKLALKLGYTRGERYATFAIQ